MDLIELKANIRKKTGKGPARVLRQEGKIPAILYGPGTDSVLLSVNVAELEQVLKKGRVRQILINLKIDGYQSSTISTIIKEIIRDPVSDNLRHLDFYEISMDRKIKVNVPVLAKGHSKGVEAGGLLQIVRRELEVLCLPGEIPNSVEIDITDFDIGDSVHVEDIEIEGDVEIPADVNFTVLTIVAPKVEVEEVEEEEEEEGEGEGEGEDADAEAEEE